MHKLLNTSVNMPTIHDHIGVKIAEVIDPYEAFTTAIDIEIITQVYNVNIDVVINVLYTEENLKIIRDFFDTQGYYPELWNNLQDTEYYKDANRGSLEIPTSENSRFFHFNKYTTINDGVKPYNETFGDDAFTQRGAPNNIAMTTTPVFFYWDEAARDTYVDPKNFTSFNHNGVSYGFATPYTMHNYDQYGLRLDDVVLIQLRTNGVGGIPLDLFSDPTGTGLKRLKYGRRCGYDHHATAYSTAIITPYSGYANTDIGVRAAAHHDNGNPDDVYSYATTINHIRSRQNLSLMVDFSPYMTQTYIGANNPALEYNTTTNRFELKRFHTGNNVGNDNSAGDPSEFINSKSLCPPANLTEREIEAPAKNQDGGNTVYKINPRPPQFGFSPNFKPYARYDQAYRVKPYPEKSTTMINDFDAKGYNTIKYSGMNPNIQPYEIFDAHGGIYIDNWGFDEDTWEDSFWDILGFDYYAVAAPPSSKNVLTRRVDNENSGALYRPTTNAEVVQTDTKNFITNQFGATMFHTGLPFPQGVVNYTALKSGGIDQFFYALGPSFTPLNAQPLELWNEVAVLTQSTTITATDIQKSVLRPYYTIRSNILEGATAIGGNPTGANLPIIGIVDKYSAASDYFMGNPSDITFTVTKSTMIADITTSIHDSDGEYANVDRTSAVIYKIEKIRRTPVGIIEEILEGKKKTNKKKKNLK